MGTRDRVRRYTLRGMGRARRPGGVPRRAGCRATRHSLEPLMMLLTILALLAQLTSTPGTVVDATNDRPLAGVVVQIVGSAAAPVATDSAGRFAVDLTSPARLRFTRVGYAATEVAVTPGRAVAMRMTPSPQALERVTV